MARNYMIRDLKRTTIQINKANRLGWQIGTRALHQAASQISLYVPELYGAKVRTNFISMEIMPVSYTNGIHNLCLIKAIFWVILAAFQANVLTWMDYLLWWFYYLRSSIKPHSASVANNFIVEMFVDASNNVWDSVLAWNRPLLAAVYFNQP